MSLYLAIFDTSDNELDGFQVGTYHDYGIFIDAVVRNVEAGAKGSICPTLVNHHDSDGHWTTEECRVLVSELNEAKAILEKMPPQKFSYDWANFSVESDTNEITNLHSSLQNVDGEPIVDALLSLCELAIKNNASIYFQ